MFNPLYAPYPVPSNDNPLDGVRLQADYARKLGSLNWESGYQYRYLKHSGDFSYLDKDFPTGRLVVNPEFTTGILLRRDIHSVYSQVSGAKDKLEYGGGLRLEYFDRRVSLDRPDTTHRLDRLNLFPFFNLKYQLQEGLALKAGYSRRIERTTTFKMTPFPEREHNETLEPGDAELLPELIDAVELGVTGTWKDNSAFANLYFRQVDNVINRVNTVYNDTILNRTYTNAGDARAFGLELGTTLYPTTNWQVYFNGHPTAGGGLPLYAGQAGGQTARHGVRWPGVLVQCCLRLRWKGSPPTVSSPPP